MQNTESNEYTFTSLNSRIQNISVIAVDNFNGRSLDVSSEVYFNSRPVVNIESSYYLDNVLGFTGNSIDMDDTVNCSWFYLNSDEYLSSYADSVNFDNLFDTLGSSCQLSSENDVTAH